MVARRYALGELPQVIPRQQFEQFRLPDQYDLQQLALAGLQVGQQPDQLQQRR